MLNIHHLRNEFAKQTLDIGDLPNDPLEAFIMWFSQAVEAKVLEPNAMSLATVSPMGTPSSRIVLLKEIRSDGFVFFTNYQSQKALHLTHNSACALNFVWNELERQVRIEGRAKKITAKESDKYFEVRPENSKLGAWASPQSRIIPDRSYLDTLFEQTKRMFAGKNISRPPMWGGYVVEPSVIEFWQGRSNRLHDRLQYVKDEQSKWICQRLAP